MTNFAPIFWVDPSKKLVTCRGGYLLGEAQRHAAKFLQLLVDTRT